MNREPWSRLLRWYARAKRDLPWRRTRDPYRIWISEIMLQQTRVEAVLGYYQRFLERFPTVEALAVAPEPELLDAWAGLGYYRRARMVQTAARSIVEQGGFPTDYEGIRVLSGIGDYTAAAVASIAFELPHAVLDGNVARVGARLTNEARDVTRAPVRRALQALVQGWIEQTRPGERGDLNQALMELGATVCTPKSPRCLLCPISADCAARKEGVQEQRPVKRAKAPQQKLFLIVALVEKNGRLLMRQRPADEAIMPGFWELPQAMGPRFDPDCLAGLGLEVGEMQGEFRHGITTRDFRGQVHAAALRGERDPDYVWLGPSERESLPLTTITKKALRAAKIL
ncbi:MAG: A/G-specific adenine glycosylase [Acidobacteria bacterium]|nr:A/G-specific adenine glycosylase [Acidobacteriota bacterium]